MITKELVDSLVSKIKDADIIRSASFLLSSLIKKFSTEESLKAVNDFLESKGWLLKTDDKDFIENISHKSIIDIEKWVDYNLKKK